MTGGGRQIHLFRQFRNGLSTIVLKVGEDLHIGLVELQWFIHIL
jgi:hypothetical protein